MDSGPDQPKRRYNSASRKRKAEATRTALVTAGRSLFGQLGFHETGLPEVVETAEVTRGALYHHFDGKTELFAAVFDQVAEELRREADQKARQLEGDTWTKLMGGLSNYLQLLATSNETQRILMIDGPVVLGWERWRAVQEQSIFSGTLQTFEMLRDEGVVTGYCPRALAHLVHASLNEASLAIAHALDHHGESERMKSALRGLLQGLRIPEP